MSLDMINIKSTLSGSGITFKKILRGSDRKEVWSAGAIVTYMVDIGVTHTEEVYNGASCLTPTKFDPQAYADEMIRQGKWESGWTFKGWRKDTVASSDIETSVIMGTEPIALYAVYSKTITETFIDYDGTKNNSYPVESTAYYNAAGNTKYETITAPSAAEWSGMTFQGWGYPNDGSMSVNVITGQSWTSTSDCTRYAIYANTIYLYYVVGGSTNSVPGTVWCNVSGGWLYPTLAVSNPTISGATFNGWSVNAGNATVSYSSLESGIQLSSNLTVYAILAYSNVTLKSGSSSYNYGSGNQINVLTGLDGSKYASLNVTIGGGELHCARWANVCDAYIYLRTKRSNGTAYDAEVLLNTCWEDGYWTGDQYIGSSQLNTIVGIDLYPGETGQTLYVSFEGDIGGDGGTVQISTITAIGKTVVG